MANHITEPVQQTQVIYGINKQLLEATIQTLLRATHPSPINVIWSLIENLNQLQPINENTKKNKYKRKIENKIEQKIENEIQEVKDESRNK